MVQHWTRLIERSTCWAVTACLAFGVASVVWAAGAEVTETSIDAVIVKYRDADGASTTLSGTRLQQIGTALQTGFALSGPTAAGAFKLTFAQPLAIDRARAAVNRLRLAPDILYAGFAPAPSPTASERRRVKSLVGAQATSRLIVKYTDPARASAALAGVPPDSSELTRLSGIAGTSLAFVRSMHDGANVLRMMRALPIEDVEMIAAQIAAQPGVAFAQPDYIDHIALTPNDGQRYRRLAWAA